MNNDQRLTDVTAVQYGAGPIGSRIVETAVAHGIEFDGAVDIDPEKIGTDLGRVAGLDTELGVEVTDDADAALASNPDVVFHATQSSLKAVRPQLEACLRAGSNVVSTTEELVYPWRDHPELAAELDQVATRAGCTLLGTGINPGYAMDFLPVVLTTPCQEVNQVKVMRVQDAATRRKPLQEKIGVGRSVEAFGREIETEAGHIGLHESVAMIEAAIGWDLDTIEESLDPVIAEQAIESEFFSVKAGEVAGIRQTGRGLKDDEPVIELDLKMSLDASNPHDQVSISGTPDLEVTTTGGFHGDITTPAIVVNSARCVLSAAPGFATMIDLPPSGYSSI